MNKYLKDIHKHMHALGLGALAHANWHANYYSMDNDFWAELSVIQAAHAMEILVKSRIAREHPLLIFESLPKPKDAESLLDLEHLAERGRTYDYSDLPDLLWATTGVRMPNLELFQSFGRLRNRIQHFTSPPRRVSFDAIDYIYGVIDPFINECWDECAIDFNEDPEPYVYLVNNLIQNEVEFIVSDGLIKSMGNSEFEWDKCSKEYEAAMKRRISDARKNAASKKE